MEVKRATFEEVNKAQLELIFDNIKILSEKNETVSPNSRRDFFDLFAFALLGKGIDYDFIFQYENGSYNLGNLSVFARKLCFFETSNPVIQLKASKKNVPIHLLWDALRDNLYKPMDEALTLGLRSSAEILGSGGGSHRVESDKKESGESTK